jgi:plastocyanin
MGEGDLVTKRRLLFLPLAAFVLLAAAAGATTQQTPAAAAPSTIKVQAGGGEAGYAINAFLPGEVTVETGSTVQWVFPWLEPHNVAILPDGAPVPTDEPAVSTPPVTWPNAAGYVYSGDIFGDPANPPTFSTTFSTAGDYTYFCAIHPGKTAKVHVKASGAQTQAQVDAAGKAEYQTRLDAVKAAAGAVNKPASVTPQANGTNKFTLTVGATDQQGDDAQQFFPASQTIKAGDTVEWVSSVFTPHTVTFGTPAPGDPFAAPMAPASGATFAGGDANSGVIGAAQAQYPNGTSYSLVFTTPGTYAYYCILHQPQGMEAKIVVEAAPASPTPTQTKPPTTPTASPTVVAPGPPSTGSGTSAGSGGIDVLWLGAGAAMLAFLFLGGGAAVAVRRR